MNLAAVCTQVCAAVTETAIFIRQEVGKVSFEQIEVKQRNHLVSYVDRTAEQQLVEHLRLILPEAGFITEEGTVETDEQAEWKWVIDPLDGTTNFLHNLPVFAISVGLMQGKEVMVGVVMEVNPK